jgi:hypothetical protein
MRGFGSTRRRIVWLEEEAILVHDRASARPLGVSQGKFIHISRDAMTAFFRYIFCTSSKVRLG